MQDVQDVQGFLHPGLQVEKSGCVKVTRKTLQTLHKLFDPAHAEIKRTSFVFFAELKRDLCGFL